MTVNAILACDENWGIGKNNALPWPKNDYDMKWFKENTDGHIVIMGRKTWESIGSKPLPNRKNIVITRQDLMSNDIKPTATWSGELNACINYLRNTYPELKVWIIGGADIYKQAIPFCDHIYLTKIKGTYECDTFIDQDLLIPFYKLTEKNNTADCAFSIWRRM